jgi:hypothetical protein
MVVYVQKPLVGGKRTTCHFNHGLAILLWGTK